MKLFVRFQEVFRKGSSILDMSFQDVIKHTFYTKKKQILLHKSLLSMIKDYHTRYSRIIRKNNSDQLKEVQEDQTLHCHEYV